MVALDRPLPTPLSWILPAAAAGLALGIAVGLARGETAQAPIIGVFFAALLAASTIDLRERRIPNRITYPGTAVALVLAALSSALLDALAGLAFGAGITGLVYIVGRGRLGMGDVKLSAMAGATLGLYGSQLFLLVGVGLGALIAIAMLVATRDRTRTMAYGPPLAAGAMIAVVINGVLATL